MEHGPIGTLVVFRTRTEGLDRRSGVLYSDGGLTCSVPGLHGGQVSRPRGYFHASRETADIQGASTRRSVFAMGMYYEATTVEEDET